MSDRLLYVEAVSKLWEQNFWTRDRTWLMENIIRCVSISFTADVGNKFDVVHVMSWCTIRNKLCWSTHRLCFPANPADLPACATTDPLSLQLTASISHWTLFKRTSEKKQKTCVSPLAPQIHKVIKVPGGWYACRIMERQKEGKTLSVIFSPISFFSLVRKLNLEVEWDIIQTSLHRGEKHDSTKSRCLNYIRQHLTSSLPATPILTSQLHHVSRGGKGPLLLFTPRLWVKQHLTADPSAKCEPRWFWNKSCRLCLQKKGEADGLWN